MVHSLLLYNFSNHFEHRISSKGERITLNQIMATGQRVYELYFTDAKEEELLQQVARFIADKYDVNPFTGDYGEAIVDKDEAPNERMLFNPTEYHRKTKMVYDYAEKVARVGAFKLKERDGLVDEYPAGHDMELENFIKSGIDFDVHFEEIVRYLANLSSFSGIYGALDMFVNKAMKPFQENTLGGSIQGFYNQFVAKAYHYNETDSVPVKIGIIKHIVNDLRSGENSVLRILNSQEESDTKPYIFQFVENFKMRMIVDRRVNNFYILQNARRRMSDKLNPQQLLGFFIQRFISSDSPPSADLVKKVLSSDESFYASINLTLKSINNFFAKYNLDPRHKTKLRQRFITLAKNYSKKVMNKNKNYTKIISLMDVEKDDLVFVRNRLEFKDHTIPVYKQDKPKEVKGYITSIFRNNQIFRDVEMQGVVSNWGNPFFLHPNVVEDNVDWFFSPDFIKFLYKDAEPETRATAAVKSIEDMILKMIMNSKHESVVKSGLKGKLKNKNVNVSGSDLTPNFFQDSIVFGGYRLSECVTKINLHLDDILFKSSKAFRVRDRWYTFDESGLKINPFQTDDGKDIDDAHSTLAGAANKKMKEILADTAIPISILEEDNSELFDLYENVRTMKLKDKKDLPSLHSIRTDYEQNRVVKNALFKDSFVDVEKGKYKIGDDFLPAYVEDINLCFEDGGMIDESKSTNVFEVQPGKIMFKNAFYDLKKDSIVLDTRLNAIYTALKGSHSAFSDTDMAYLMDNYPNIIPALLHHSNSNFTYDRIFIPYFHRMLELYGYDMTNSNAERVIILDPDSKKLELRSWIGTLFQSVKNRLSGESDRKITNVMTPQQKTKTIPKLEFDKDKDGNLKEYVFVKFKEHHFYLINDLPILYKCDKISDLSRSWILEFVELLNYYHFDITLAPLRNTHTGDYHTVVVAPYIPTSYGDYFKFITSNYPHVVEQQVFPPLKGALVGKTVQLKIPIIDTVSSLFTDDKLNLINVSDSHTSKRNYDGLLGHNLYQAIMRMMVHINETWRIMRRKGKSRTTVPLVNLEIPDSLVLSSSSIKPGLVISQLDFNNLL